MSAARARDVAELFSALGKMITPEGRRRALAFRPRASDVIIATYPKCGTTWLQQIVHGLRTRGSMDFPEITAVVPWLELAHDMGVDPDAPQVAEPRAFKSHLSFHDVPNGARYVTVLRDPGDAAVSLYRFFDGWRMEPGAIALDTFALEFFLHREPGRRYWDHVLSWWQQHRDPSVLMLCYEDMLDDAFATVSRVARFIGVEADRTLLDTVVAQSSIDFMKRHERQFDDHLVREARDSACGLPPGGRATKVATGRAGDARHRLGNAVHAAFDAAWREVITPSTGLPDYGAMRRALRAAEAARAARASAGSGR